jgi:predicted nucleic acid-binding protein
LNLPELVLIDTCMWVPFFNRPRSPIKLVIDELLDEDRGGLIGPVVTEILCGFRRDAEADWVSSILRGVYYLEVTWEDWRDAAKLGRRLAAQGHVVPVTDLALAAVSRRCDCAVYTTDPHFDLVPELKRFRPQ